MVNMLYDISAKYASPPPPKKPDWGEIVFIIAWIILMMAFTIVSLSCATREHLRETLQKENPDCIVYDDLTMICTPYQNDNVHP